MPCLSNEITPSELKTPGGELFFPIHTNPCAIARSHCQRDYRRPSLKEPDLPFRNRTVIIQEGQAIIPEQFATGQDLENADRKIGTLRRVLHEILDHVSKHRCRVVRGITCIGLRKGAARGARRVFQAGGLMMTSTGNRWTQSESRTKKDFPLSCESVGITRNTTQAPESFRMGSS